MVDGCKSFEISSISIMLWTDENNAFPAASYLKNKSYESIRLEFQRKNHMHKRDEPA